MIQPRDRSGRYDHGTKCDACGKSAENYLTDERVCGGTDGPGFYLCKRAACSKRRDAREAKHGLVGLERLYTEQRAKNDKRKRSRATNRKGANMATPVSAIGLDAERLADVAESLARYSEHHVQPGDFLIAVLSNDLMMSVGRGDDLSRKLIVHIARMVYALPRRCWGSREIVAAWLAR